MQDGFDDIEEGKNSYQRWVDQLHAKPGFQKIYEEEAAKKELWLHMVEARLQSGITQVELARRLGISLKKVARMERRGYDVCTLNKLREYVKALDEVLTPEGGHSGFFPHR